MTPDPTSPPPVAPPPPATARRRWPRRLLGLAVLLGVAVWFAPALVAKTGLRNRLIASATADLRGTVTVGGMSAGWLSAVELRDVTLADTQGRTVLTVPRVVTAKTLFGLVRDRSDFGEIEIQSPSVEVVCEGTRTNLEDVLADMLKDDGRPQTPNRPAVRVRVTDGTITLRDAATAKSAPFTGVTVTAAVPTDRSAPIDVTLTATAPGGSPGTIEVKAGVGASGTVEVKANGFPLDAVTAVLRRFQPGLVVNGSLSAEVRGSWATGDSPRAEAEGVVGLKNLDVSGPALNGDRLVVPTADLPFKGELAGGMARIQVSGGRLTLADGVDGKTVELVAVSASLAAPVDGKGAAIASAALTAAGPAGGTLEVEATVADAGIAKLRAAGFPLAALAPVLRRIEPGCSLSGSLTANLTAGWEEGGKMARVEGAAGVRNLDLGAPWLNGDRVRLAAADLPLKAERRGNSVRVEKAELTCDVGRLSAAGAFDPSDPPERILDKPGVTLAADIDLAKLAGLLPNLLRVREGTAVREGRLVASLVSRAGKDGTTWDGSVRTSALKAVRDGKGIEWPEPLSVEFSARALGGQLPVFDKLLCKSEFVAVNAQGSAESVRAAANVYLDRLAARLGEFADLGGLALGGEATAWVIGSRTPAGAFKADAGAELKNFTFAKPGVRGLSEPNLTLKASATGAWPTGGAIRLDATTVEMTAGADRFEARLMAPVPDVKAAAGGRVAVHVAGDLGRWAERTRGFVGVPPDYRFGGTIDASGTFALDARAVTSDRVVVAIRNAHFRGAGLDLNEPVLNAFGPLNMTRASGEVVLAPVLIDCPALTVRNGRFTFEFPDKAPMVVAGSGLCTSDLNRLAATLQLQTSPDGPDSFHGRGAGPVRFRWQGDTTTFGGTVDATDFAYGPKAVPTLREPRFKLDLDAKYDQSADRVTVMAGRIERPGMAVEGKGTWAFNATQDVDLAGKLDYDLAVLTPEVRNAVGGAFQAAGKGSRPFALRGSLSPPGGKGISLAALTANGGVAWEAVRAYGFEMGPGEFNARLANGVGTLSPVSATFGGGRVNLTPTVKLTPGPGELSFAKGRVVEKAKLTPAVCAGAIGYALPVVAGAAQAEGEVSFDLDDNRIPLTDFTGAALRGRLLVHRAAVSAGPVISEVVQLLGESAPRLVLANEMTVPIRVEAGRVHHENLTLTVNGYAIKTNGSVGFDGTLAVVADVPIPGTFPGLKNNPALKKALEGRVVKVPIGGTMTKPAIDRGAFNAAVAAVARDAAKDAVKDAGRDLLNRELERLFPGGAPGAMPGGTPTPAPGGRPPLFPLPSGLPFPVPKK